MTEGIEVMLAAERPNDPGLDLVFVHGLLTLGLPDLPSTWAVTLEALAPSNSSITGYNANLEIHNSFQWKDVQSKTTSLISSLQGQVKQMKRGGRSFVFLCIGLAGYIVKHALFRFADQNLNKDCWELTSGVVFFGTPHFTESDEKAAYQLAGILQYDLFKATGWPGMFTKSDLSSMVFCGWRFDELKIQFPILSCHESEPMKARSRRLLSMSHTVTMADEKMVSLTAGATQVQSCAIDTKLSSLFNETDCVIHKRLKDFLARLMKLEKLAAQSAGSSTLAKLHTKQDTDIKRAASIVPGHLAAQTFPITVRSKNSSPPFLEKTAPTMSPQLSPTRQLSITSIDPPSSEPLRSSSQLSNGRSSSFQMVNTPPGRSPRSTLSDSSASFLGLPPMPHVREHIRTVRTPLEWIQAGACRKPNIDFCGRTDLIQEMEIRLLQLSEIDLRAISRPNVFVLFGAAGLGKTQTALEFFHSSKAQFDVRLWIQANSKDSLYVVFKELSVRLGLESRKDANDSVLSRELVKGWMMEPFQNLTTMSGKLLRWLLVIDNADDPDDVLDFWPYDGQGVIVVTSRNRGSMTQNYFGECGCELSTLAVDDAVTFLEKLLERNHRPRETLRDLRQVVTKLDCWPLAIAQMAGIVCRRKQSLGRFLEIYESPECRHQYHSMKVGHLHGGYALTLTAAWALEDIAKGDVGCEGAPPLLSVISLLAPESIPESLLTKTPERAKLPGYPLTATQYYEAIQRIESCSVISYQRQDNATESVDISIHPLIQDVIRGQLLMEENTIVSTFNTAIGLMTGVWPFETLPFYGFRDPDRIWRRGECDKLLPHITQLVRFYKTLPGATRRKCTTADFLNILTEIGWCEYKRFNMDQSLKYIQFTMEVLDEDPGQHRRIRAVILGTWGNLAMETDQPEVALDKNLEALGIRQALYEETGIVDSQLTASYTETARAMMMNGMFEKAKAYIETSISLRQSMPQFSRLQLYSPLCYMAQIHIYWGAYESAAINILDAMRDREIEYGRPDDCENKRMGLLLTYMGTILGKQGFHDEALGYYERAKAQLIATGGNEDLDTANVYYKIATQYLRHDDPELADAAIRQALQTLQRSRFHSGEVARAKFLQSKILLELNQIEAAACALQESTEIRRQLVNNDMRPAEVLTELDYDELVVIWRR